MELNFEPPGPIGAAFMKSHAPVNSIMGPVGSAKTSCLMMKTIENSARQPRSKLDGIRYTKALFVRETFRQLYGTTIPSWHTWMPKNAGEWRGGGNEPGQHHLKFLLPDSSVVDLQVIFEALGDQNVETLMRGKEFNLLNLNEGDTLNPDVLAQGLVRVAQGRYPGERHVDPELCVKEVNIDYNAPDIENYLYRLNEENRPAEYAFFRQPGGLDANAENRRRATLKGYQDMARDLEAQGRGDLVRRMINNQYGYSRDGKPVFLEYRDDFHCALSELEPLKGIPVKLYADQGLHPALIFTQNTKEGQRRVLDEIRGEGGAVGLAEEALRMIGGKYHGCHVTGGLTDPASAARSGNDAESWIDCLNRLLGFRGAQKIRLAPTNDVEKRLSAVRRALKNNVGQAQAGILISTTCRLLRKGFNSEYKYKKIAGGGANAFRDVPDKNIYSDPMDALQYYCLDDGGYEEVTGREDRRASGSFSGMKVAKVK
ncbi:MAG: hypothetical protein PSY14_06765 [bacterium]|nr:hypothetical protein [bacterium]